MQEPWETPAFSLSQAPTARRGGRRWLLLGGIALALTLGVGAVLGSALGSGKAQAASITASGATGSRAQFAAPGGAPPNFAPGGANTGQASTPTPGAPGRHGGQGQCMRLTVTSVNGSTIVAKASDGSAVTITVSSSTTYRKAGQAAALSDISVGSVISVMGTRNSDGSITATSIDILG
jgi:hypothetical protein